MEISENGLRLIEAFEGFIGNPYQDSVGVWTIGYGHTHGIGPSTPPITQGEAEALLRTDVNDEYGAAVNRLGRLRLTQNEFDATTSFVYNLGPGVLSDGGFGRLLRSEQYHAAADSMLGYDHAGGQVLEGLRMRRERERQLFLTPDSVPPTHPKPKPKAIDMLLPGERKVMDAYLTALRHPVRQHVTLGRERTLLVNIRKGIYRAAVDGVEADGSKTEPGWGVLHRAVRYHFISLYVPPGK